MKLGKIVMTIGISEKIQKNKEFSKKVAKSLYRYASNDWGELSEEDKKANDKALKINDRVLAAYETIEGKIWIITEWDRSYTTILFPEEY